MKCTDCGYFWKDEGEQYGTCHFVPVCAGDYSPCEQEDIDRQRELDRREEEEEREYLTRMFEEDEEDDYGPEDILEDESKTAFEKLTALLEYEGIIGYEHVIGEWLMELYGIDVTEDPNEGKENKR